MKNGKVRHFYKKGDGYLRAAGELCVEEIIIDVLEIKQNFLQQEPSLVLTVIQI